MSRPAAIAVLLLALSLACNPMAEKADAEAFAANLFSARLQGDAEQAVLLYSDLPDQGTRREDWAAFLSAIEAKLGRPKTYEQQGWSVNVGTYSVGTGTMVTLEFAVAYENAEGTESLTLFRPSGSPEFSVVGHHVNSPALLFDQQTPGAARSKRTDEKSL